MVNINLLGESYPIELPDHTYYIQDSTMSAVLYYEFRFNNKVKIYPIFYPKRSIIYETNCRKTKNRLTSFYNKNVQLYKFLLTDNEIYNLFKERLLMSTVFDYQLIYDIKYSKIDNIFGSNFTISNNRIVINKKGMFKSDNKNIKLKRDLENNITIVRTTHTKYLESLSKITNYKKTIYFYNDLNNRIEYLKNNMNNIPKSLYKKVYNTFYLWCKYNTDSSDLIFNIFSGLIDDMSDYLGYDVKTRLQFLH